MTSPGYIAADGAGVYYWTEPGTGSTTGKVWKWSGTGAAAPFATGLSYPGAIAADTSYVYFTSGFGGGAVESIPAGGGSPSSHPTGASTVPVGIALASSHVYWADSMSGQVGTCGEGSCTPGFFETSAQNAWAVTTDSSHVYWTEYGATGAVYRALIGSPSTIEPVGGTENTPVRIVVDGSAIVFADNGSGGPTGSIRSCSVTTPTSCVTLASNVQGPLGLAMDSKAVYYGTNNVSNYGIWMVAR